jgi:myo-inositol-1(or 4)-monophosphatase
MDLLELSKSAVNCAINELLELEKNNVKQYVFSKEIPREVKASADTIIEKILIDKLSSSGLTILSEESGQIQSNSNSSLRFIIDPIDGTVNFVRGIPICSISVALFDGDLPIFGVLGSYPSGALAWGGREIGSFVDNIKIKVSSIDKPHKGLLCTGFPSRFKFNSKSMAKQTNLMSKFSKVRMLGSATQSLLLVAEGSAEMYSETDIMLWDVAAGLAIVEGAGGVCFINPGSLKYALDVTASNGLIKNI